MSRRDPQRFVRSVSPAAPLLLLLAMAPACEPASGAHVATPPQTPAAGERGAATSQAAWDACLGAPPGPGRGYSLQGPELLGTHVSGSEDRWAIVRTFLLDGMTTADGAPIQAVRVTRSGLVGEVGKGPLSGAGFKGARLHATLACAAGAPSPSLTLDAEIEDAVRDPQRADREAWLYRVKLLHAPVAAAALCDADAKGESGAQAFPGVWDANGAHREQAGAFSFACSSAAVLECDRWGYRFDEAPDLHATCTRMARADYCGDGRSATKRGTEINSWDGARRVQRAPTRDGAKFEAAWTPAGAVCMDHARWPKLAHECGRSGKGLNELTVPVCHSQAEAEALAGPGKVLLFNESKENQL